MRNLLQKRLARMIPVETIGSLTVAALRQMADEESGGATAEAAAAKPEQPDKEATAEQQKEGATALSEVLAG